MARLLLINPVIREFAPPNNVPLGLCYIASYLEKYGHEVDICDMNAHRWQYSGEGYREYWLERYEWRNYDIIGLSGLIVTYQEQRRYLDFILEHRLGFGYPKIISGGGLATSVPEFTLRNMPELDLLVLGEGEDTALELANRLDDGDSLIGTPGTATMDADGNVQYAAARELIPDLGKLPLPAWEKVPVEEVYLPNSIWGSRAGNSSQITYESQRSMNMIAARGCPYNCAFCYNLFGRKYRVRHHLDVIIEMMLLQKLFGVDFCGFVNDNSIAKRSWMVQFCKMLQSLDLGMRWGCHARVDAVEPEILAEMKKAGCEWIGFGIESGSQRILDRMNKRTTPEIAAIAIEWVRDAGITANTTYIAGYWGETVDDLRMTADFMRNNDSLNSMFFCQPYPGTELYSQVKDMILSETAYDTEDSYIKSLGDGTELRANIADMSTETLIECRDKAMKGVAF